MKKKEVDLMYKVTFKWEFWNKWWDRKSVKLNYQKEK